MFELNSLFAFVSKFESVLNSFVFFNIFKFFPSVKMEMPLSIFFIILMGLVSIVGLRLFPLKAFLLSILELFKKDENANESEGLSKFESVASAVSAATGLGFLGGIGSAVATFGPGIVFYIPIAAVFASCIRFFEICLVHKYREKDDSGVFFGNPEMYSKKIFAAIGFPRVGIVLATVYAFIIIMTSFFGPAMLEVNQIAKTVADFEIFRGSELVVSFIAVLLASFVIFGGIKRISAFFSQVMPILIATFFIVSLVTIFQNKANILNTCKIIFSDAFTPQSKVAGSCIVLFFIAIRRILVGTEAGFGTASSMHAPSKESNSVKEAISGMISPFIGSIFVAFLVGFLVVLTDAYKVADPRGGVTILSYALTTGHPAFKIVLTILTICMALNVLIGWSYYGVVNAKNLFGKYSKYPYLLLYLFAGFVGGIVNDFRIILSLTDCIFFVIPILHFFIMTFGCKSVSKDIKDYECCK